MGDEASADCTPGHPPTSTPRQSTPTPLSRTPATHSILPALTFDIASIELEGEEDPRNWSTQRKWYTTTVISLMGFVSPLGSSIVVPGDFFVDLEFRLHSRTLSLLTVSFFVLGLGIGPFLLAPASELRGRQPIYLLSSFIFVLFNLGSTLVGNFPGLLVLRFLAGAAGSAGPSLGAGSIGDMFSPRDRGRAQSLYGLGPLLGPVCGTIAGGWISQSLRDWRWLLGILTMLSGVISLIAVLTLRETYSPVLRRKKVVKLAREHLRIVSELKPANDHEQEVWQVHCVEVTNLVEPSRGMAGASKLPPRMRRAVNWFVASPELVIKLKLAFSRPFRLLFGNPICAIFSLYMGYIYGIIFLFITQHPLLFQRREDPEDPSPQRLPTYGWKEGVASLTYLGLGLGFIAAATINILLQDSIYARLVLSNGRLGWFLFRDRTYIAEHISQDKAVKEDKEAQADTANGAEGGSGNRTMNRVMKTLKAPATLDPPPNKGRPEYRLPLCLAGMIILPCGLLLFGWSASSRTHFILPLFGSFLVGMGSILPFQSILVYLVDAFIPYSASATACAVLVRCVLAAVFPLFSQQLFVAIGYGWGSTILALVSMLAIPAPILLYIHGEHLRARFKFQG